MPNIRRLVIALDGVERTALATLAARERRDIREQAAMLICRALIQDGLLSAERDGAQVNESGVQRVVQTT